MKKEADKLMAEREKITKGLSNNQQDKENMGNNSDQLIDQLEGKLEQIEQRLQESQQEYEIL